MRKLVCLIGTALIMAGTVADAAAAPAGKRMLRRLLDRLLGRETQQVLRRDLARDRKLPVRTLKEPRTVFRYTSRSRAQHELHGGLRPGVHVTARGGPGRPPTAENAQRRYGLPHRPEVRETIRLPAGMRVRQGKVIGGRPGYGEIVLDRPLSPEHIRRVAPLKTQRPK